jgi:hypothetical protein
MVEPPSPAAGAEELGRAGSRSGVEIPRTYSTGSTSATDCNVHQVEIAAALADGPAAAPHQRSGL